MRPIAGNIAADASSDPRDTYRVMRITIDEDRARDEQGQGLDHEHRPHAGPHAAPAAEAEEDRARRADDGREGTGDLDDRLAGHDPGEDDRQDALEQVADDHDGRPLASEGPEGVRAAGAPGPDRSRVGAAAEPGDQHAHGDRAGQVRHEDEGQVDGDGPRVHARCSVNVPRARHGPARTARSRRACGARTESSTGSRPIRARARAARAGPRGPFGHGCASADVARTIEPMTQPLRRLPSPAVSEPL